MRLWRPSPGGKTNASIRVEISADNNRRTSYGTINTVSNVMETPLPNTKISSHGDICNVSNVEEIPPSDSRRIESWLCSREIQNAII
jgi:hypothetical protein